VLIGHSKVLNLVGLSVDPSVPPKKQKQFNLTITNFVPYSINIFFQLIEGGRIVMGGKLVVGPQQPLKK